MYRFRPHLVPSLLAAAALTVLWSLAAWQYRRLGEAEEARVDYAERLARPPFDASSPPEDPEDRRAAVEGVPDWDRHLLVAGRYMWGYRGYQLLVPVQSGTTTVLVDAGWIPVQEKDLVIEKERAVPVPRRYAGIARVAGPESDARGGFSPESRMWRAVAPVAMGEALGIDLPGWYLVDGEGLAADAPIADREPPISGWRTTPPERPHAEYALTWFGLGLSLLLVWLTASFRKVADGSGMV